MRVVAGWLCIAASVFCGFTVIFGAVRAFNTPSFLMDQATAWTAVAVYGVLSFALWKTGRRLTRKRTKRRWHDPE